MPEGSLPPRLNWADSDLTMLCQCLNNNVNYISLLRKKEKQVDHILLFSGETGIRNSKSWKLTDAEKEDPEAVWKKFQNQVHTKENWRVACLYL